VVPGAGDEMASRLPATGRMVLVDGKSITYAYRSLTRIMTRTGLQRKVLHKEVVVLVPDSPCKSLVPKGVIAHISTVLSL